jgi:putative ABC transport system ATP-binding protein
MLTHERHIAEHADRIVHIVDGRIEEIEQVDSAVGNNAADDDSGHAGR